MCRTIAFDYQLRFSTIEVSNIITELMLAPEFESEQSTIAEQILKESFCRCLALSQFAGKLHQA